MTLQPYIYANDQSRRRTILLVEDEPFVREATCNILQRAGFEVLKSLAICGTSITTKETAQPLD
jgi:CheY-like chemotaxis protein